MLCQMRELVSNSLKRYMLCMALFVGFFCTRQRTLCQNAVLCTKVTTRIYIKMIDFANLSAGQIMLLFTVYIQVTNFTLYTLMQNSVLHVLYTWKERKRKMKRRSQSSFNLDFEIVWYMHFFLKPSWESRETTIKATLISSPVSPCKPSLPFRSFSPCMSSSPKINQHLEGC